MQYMYDSSQTLFHMAILGGEWTVMKLSTKCDRCDLFQTMSELSAWPACGHTDFFARAKQVLQIELLPYTKLFIATALYV